MPDMQGVVLLHGIFRSRRQMEKLARFLKSQGYQTLNLSYPSTRMPLEEIAPYIHPEIHRFSTDLSELHFVGFSMGGLVIRTYLNRFRPPHLGHVVMLGTPNNGSEFANWLQHAWLYQKFYGPAGQQLVTRLKGADALFGPVDYPLGIIAGVFAYDPLAAHLIQSPNDGKVSVESTKLPGMREHKVISAWHTFLPMKRKAWELVLHFLQAGRFP